MRSMFCAWLVVVIAGTAPSLLLAERVGGPGFHEAEAAADERVAYTVEFHGGRLARIVVHGDGASDLDLYVWDDNDVLVAVDESLSHDCHVRWVPRRTGRFRVVVHNRGVRSSRFTVATN